MTEAGWTHVANVKAEGWYWWRRSVGYHKALKVYSVAGSLCVAQGDDHVPIEEIDGGEFLGPITPDSYQQGRVAGLVSGAQLVRWHKSCAFEADPALALERAAKDIESVASQIIQPQQAQDEKGVGDE